jgi:hypothetical protein
LWLPHDFIRLKARQAEFNAPHLSRRSQLSLKSQGPADANIVRAHAFARCADKR